MVEAVIGSRGIKNFDFTKLPLTCVVSGGAIGVDKLVEHYCTKNNIPIVVIKPDYSSFGKIAPIIRNREIVDRCDIVYAIWDGLSKGTKSVIDYAKSMGKQVEINYVKST